MAEGVTNVAFLEADAQTHSFVACGCDVVISRFGLMFFSHPEVAFANLRRALRPGGRLVFLCWQGFDRNEHAALPLRVVGARSPVPLPLPGSDGPGPYSLADAEWVQDLLRGARFDGIGIEAVEERLRVGDDADDVLGFYRAQPMAQACMAGAPADTVEAMLGAIRTALLPHESPRGVFLGSAAWVVRARA